MAKKVQAGLLGGLFRKAAHRVRYPLEQCFPFLPGMQTPPQGEQQAWNPRGR